MFQYCFNHLLVSQLRMPVSVRPGNPPQVFAAAEIALGTADTYDKNTIHINEKIFACIGYNKNENLKILKTLKAPSFMA